MTGVETLDMGGFSFTVQTTQALDLSGMTVVNAGLIQGHSGTNIIVGTTGADLIHGGGEADLLRGGAGNDTLTGGTGRDTVEGGDGDDTLRLSGSDPTGDVLDGGTGNDTLQLTGHTTLGIANMTLSSIETLNMGGFNLNVQTATPVDLSGLNLVNGGAIIGDGLANIIHGTRGNDTIRGGGETDRLRGGLGNDSLSGDGGNDILAGGEGNDWLQGGAGNDLFVFDVAPDASNADTIAGFSANATDLLALDPTLFSAIVSRGTSALDASEFRAVVGGNAVDADDFVVYDPVTGGLYYDADGSGATAKVLVATMTGLTGTFDHNDIVMTLPSGF
jgi:Ca2+-binding RTX toxin-like protein